MISLQGITKRFGRRIAVDNVSFEVPRGVIFGLLGHNGAGKSTLIGALLGQVFPDRGRVLVGGHDVVRHRGAALARVGAIFEASSFYDYLSGETNIRILCEYSGPVDETELRDVVRLVGLESRIGDRVGTYSHGMRQRLALAQALLPRPDLLILDEPTEGLDPEGMHETRNLLLRLNRQWGLTIFFSSHLLAEVQQLCSHVAVLRSGRLLFAGRWHGVGPAASAFSFRADRQSEAESALASAGIALDFGVGGRGRLAPGQTVHTVARWLIERGFEIEHIGPADTDLEAFYLDMIRQGPSHEGR